MTQRDLIQVVPLAVGGLLVAWIFPGLWARVVVPACILAFILLTIRERRQRTRR